MRRISESGIIGQDGRLRLPMDRLNAFFSSCKGMRVVVSFEIAAPRSTEIQHAYYRNYIIPCIQAALWKEGERKTEPGVDKWLRSQCPSCYTPEGELLEARDISQKDFVDFLEWAKQFAAENLFTYIEDPKTL